MTSTFVKISSKLVVAMVTLRQWLDQDWLCWGLGPYLAVTLDEVWMMSLVFSKQNGSQICSRMREISQTWPHISVQLGEDFLLLEDSPRIIDSKKVQVLIRHRYWKFKRAERNKRSRRVVEVSMLGINDVYISFLKASSPMTALFFFRFFRFFGVILEFISRMNLHDLNSCLF